MAEQVEVNRFPVGTLALYYNAHSLVKQINSGGGERKAAVELREPLPLALGISIQILAEEFLTLRS